MIKDRSISMEVKTRLCDCIIVPYASKMESRSRIYGIALRYLESVCRAQRMDGESKESVYNSGSCIPDPQSATTYSILLDVLHHFSDVWSSFFIQDWSIQAYSSVFSVILGKPHMFSDAFLGKPNGRFCL